MVHGDDDTAAWADGETLYGGKGCGGLLGHLGHAGGHVFEVASGFGSGVAGVLLEAAEVAWGVEDGT